MSSPEEAAAQIEQTRLDLETARFAHEQRINELRLELDKARLEADSRFAARHLGTIVTGLISLAAVIVSLTQLSIAYISKQKEIEVAQINERKQREITEAQQVRDWNIKAAEFVASHWSLISSSDGNTQRGMADLILVVFPPQISSPLLQRLNITDTRQGQPWKEAEKTATTALFAIIDSRSQGWMSSAKYVEDFVKQRDRGLYPAKVEGRLRDGVEEFHAEWKSDSGLSAWQSYHGMSKDDYESKNTEFTKQGYTRESLTTFKDSSGRDRYLATWTMK